MPLVFQKKQSPSGPPSAPPAAAPGETDVVVDLPLDDGAGAAAPEGTVVCPNCACEFDPVSGEVVGGYGDDTSPPPALADASDEELE